MPRAVDMLRQLVLGLAAALMPSPRRERIARSHGLDVPRYSLALGLVQLSAGIGLFMAGGIAFLRGGALATSWLLLENWQPGLTNVHVQGAGLVSWLGWFLHPAAWLFGAIALIGLLRCVAFAATREPVAEPLVAIGLWAYDRARQRRAAARRERQLGPPRPDRLLPGPDGRLVLLSCREIPQLTEDVTVAIGGRFYRLEEVGERRDGEWAVLAYRLREQRPGEVIRRLLRYEAAVTGRTAP